MPANWPPDSRNYKKLVWYMANHAQIDFNEVVGVLGEGTNTNSLRGQIQRMKREDPDNMPESSSTATPRKPKAAAGDGIKTEGGSHGGAAEVEGTPSKKPAKVTGGKRKNAGDANGEVAGGDNNGATPNKTPKKPRKTPTKKTVKQEEMEGQLL